MKKLVCIIIVILVMAGTSTKALAADRVHPDGGPQTQFNGESRGKDVNVSFADKDGDPVGSGQWDVVDGYAVDISWSSLKFLYKINDDDPEERYVSKWDPDALKWIIWDTTNNTAVDNLEGTYEVKDFTDVSGTFTKTVTNTTESVINKNLGVNGFAVTNRSSKPITTEYRYTQILPLYSNPSQALANAGHTGIKEVYGQVDDTNTSEAVLTTSYSYLKTPDYPPTSQGVCGTVTIVIKN